jgi:D-alanyl-D-alanine carboxypeptidase
MLRPKSQPIPWHKPLGNVVTAAAIVVLLVNCGNGALAVSRTITPETSVVSSPPTATATAPSARRSAPTARMSAPIGEQDGFIADGEWLTPFDTSLPAINKLDPTLLAAVQRAASDAESAGIDLFITSGWRSVRYQQALLAEAIMTYGSEEEARKWVATPEKSAHVTGDAVDIGPADANNWLNRHGNRYGLCRTYANEDWHFELATKPGGVCPPLVLDASGN